MRKLLALATLAFFFALPSASATSSICDATAGNLVVNCGFETGDFTGWTQGGNTGFTYVDSEAHSGDYAAWLGPVGSDGTLSQLLTTTSGATYNLSFYVANLGGPANDGSVWWDGTELGGFTNSEPFPYTLHSFTVTGTGSDTLLFSFRQDPSYLKLDDVAVSAVPEPGTLTLFGAGILSLAGYVRRKRRG